MSASTRGVRDTVLSLYEQNDIPIPKNEIESFHRATHTSEEYHQCPPLGPNNTYIADYKDLEMRDAENEKRWKGWKIGPGKIYEQEQDGKICHYVPSIIPPDGTTPSQSSTQGETPNATSGLGETTGYGTEGDEVSTLAALTLEDSQTNSKAV
ncbi:hypothetical protein I302_100952 [Kwoniella bestiolae CBS 10118]|uniref:Uncharacterized protein n=1 Tax=Kwoniella bestiolae CBS 10118 TaxID=1296100 RepID=A0A1B9G6L5_9TREE|nr:hypothetical protein I302_04329 [Kwoniella bestiolae CBS 10118]OCF26643.1 hypothetical protein I302_04329 [Kwoniella bestiolae CBS 10118]